MSEAHVLLGFDAGGTKTVLLGSCGDEVIRLAGPGTNLKRDGLQACTDRLGSLLGDALRALPEGKGLFVCGGVAGAGRPHERDQLESALRERLAALVSEPAVEILHDGALALENALAGARSGLVCIAGTGSIILARTMNRLVLRAGGWGARVDGDPGSGMALGRAAIAAVAADFDGGPETVLRRRFAERLGVASPDDLIRAAYAEDFDAATLAPLVIDAAAGADPVAENILLREVDALARRAGWLARRAESEGGVAHHLVLAGGLINADRYREILTSALENRLPGWTLGRSESAPEEAALALASRLADRIRSAPRRA
jgi:glucosamine kinase